MEQSSLESLGCWRGFRSGFQCRTNWFGRYARSNRVGRNVLRHDTASSNDGTRSNCYSLQHCDVGAQPNIILDDDGGRIWRLTLSPLQVIHGMKVGVIDSAVGTHEDVIANRNPFGTEDGTAGNANVVSDGQHRAWSSGQLSRMVYSRSVVPRIVGNRDMLAQFDRARRRKPELAFDGQSRWPGDAAHGKLNSGPGIPVDKEQIVNQS